MPPRQKARMRKGSNFVSKSFLQVRVAKGGGAELGNVNFYTERGIQVKFAQKEPNLELELPEYPIPPLLHSSHNRPWRYLGNQEWYHRSAGFKTTTKIPPKISEKIQ